MRNISFKCAYFLGVNSDWLDLVLNKSSTAVSSKYNGILIERLQSIIHISSQPSEFKILNASFISNTLFIQHVAYDW